VRLEDIGRRMFVVFVLEVIFSENILAAFRDKIAMLRQEQLIKEIEAEQRRDEERKAAKREKKLKKKAASKVERDDDKKKDSPLSSPPPPSVVRDGSKSQPVSCCVVIF
jgi:hypothetical protein